MKIISTSCFYAHTGPIFKGVYILRLNDMYFAEIGKIMYHYKAGRLVIILEMPPLSMFLSVETI